MSSSSRTERCASMAGVESVWTTIPSVTGVAQAGSSLREPSTSTRHMRHAATESMPGW